jgi:hypothetical protein
VGPPFELNPKSPLFSKSDLLSSCRSQRIIPTVIGTLSKHDNLSKLNIMHHVSVPLTETGMVPVTSKWTIQHAKPGIRRSL